MLTVMVIMMVVVCTIVLGILIIVLIRTDLNRPRQITDELNGIAAATEIHIDYDKYENGMPEWEALTYLKYFGQDFDFRPVISSTRLGEQWIVAVVGTGLYSSHSVGMFTYLGVRLKDVISEDVLGRRSDVVQMHFESKYSIERKSIESESGWNGWAIYSDPVREELAGTDKLLGALSTVISKWSIAEGFEIAGGWLVIDCGRFKSVDGLKEIVEMARKIEIATVEQ